MNILRQIDILTCTATPDSVVDDAFKTANTAYANEHQCRQEHKRHHRSSKFSSRHFYKLTRKSFQP